MPRLKTPQQKKAESYKHDRIEGGEYPHADRKNRPRAKAVSQRGQRRAAQQALSAQLQGKEVRSAKRFKPGWNKTSVRLPDHLKTTARSRIEREAHNLFRSGYGPRTHARFKRVITSWMDSGSRYSAAIADFYAGILAESAQNGRSLNVTGSERVYFLKQFFSREPELERAFLDWIARLKG